MALYYPSVFRIPCLLTVLCVAGCIQSPQAASFANANPGAATTVNAVAADECRRSPKQANRVALDRELSAQGVALRVHCADAETEGVVGLMVLDSARASAVLRGPLADGEQVELAWGADVSPDVQFNQAWLESVLLRHKLRLDGTAELKGSKPQLRRVDLAVR